MNSSSRSWSRGGVWLLALLSVAAGGAALAGEPSAPASGTSGISGPSEVAGAAGAAERRKAICQGQVEAPQQCQWIDGTVFISNGTPAVRIRQRGSSRVYAVGPSEQELMPTELKAKLTLDNAIDAQFRICPLKQHQTRGLRVVCIDEAVLHLRRR